MKGIIYYTDNQLIEPLFSAVQKHILASGLPIVSASLRPINFGQNVVVEGVRGYPTMVNQIIAALETSRADCVFFCEHDILYHKSYFDFVPIRDDTFYYNLNNWRWGYPSNKIIRYDGLTSLSQLCVNRELALRHYKKRRDKMIELGLENFTKKGDPYLARAMGYEPGPRKNHYNEFMAEKSDVWNSEFPNIDIRHVGTFTFSKMRYENFRRPPTGWVETTIDKIDSWNLEELLPNNK